MECNSFWMVFPFLFLGTVEGPGGTTGSLQLEEALSSLAPGVPEMGGPEAPISTLPVLGAESKWISGASMSVSGATPGTARPALGSSSSSLSSKSKASPGSSSASGEGPGPPGIS